MDRATAPRQIPRYGLLLAGFLLALTIAPLLDDVHVAQAAAVVLLLGALHVVGARWATVVLFLPALLASMVGAVSRHPVAAAASAGLHAVFLSYVTAMIVRHVVRHPHITLDTVMGAACAYVLLGIVWGDLYDVLYWARPGSFDVPASLLEGAEGTRGALMYFSFVTLTTVGYGDVRPTHLGAAGLSVSEAIVGQLYLAVMIARMVGLYIAHSTQPRGE